MGIMQKPDPEERRHVAVDQYVVATPCIWADPTVAEPALFTPGLMCPSAHFHEAGHPQEGKQLFQPFGAPHAYICAVSQVRFYPSRRSETPWQDIMLMLTEIEQGDDAARANEPIPLRTFAIEEWTLALNYGPPTHACGVLLAQYAWTIFYKTEPWLVAHGEGVLDFPPPRLQEPPSTVWRLRLALARYLGYAFAFNATGHEGEV